MQPLLLMSSLASPAEKKINEQEQNTWNRNTKLWTGDLPEDPKGRNILLFALCFCSQPTGCAQAAPSQPLRAENGINPPPSSSSLPGHTARGQTTDQSLWLAQGTLLPVTWDFLKQNWPSWLNWTTPIFIWSRDLGTLQPWAQGSVLCGVCSVLSPPSCDTAHTPQPCRQNFCCGAQHSDSPSLFFFALLF